MAGPVKFIYGSESQILALTSESVNWIDKAFYYPSDKDYFYQLVNGVMKRYGGGNEAGCGVKLNGAVMGGSKRIIEYGEVLDIPENYEYNVHYLTIFGDVNVGVNSQINIQL